VSGSTGSKCIFVLLIAASLCPVLLVPIPAMVDYPNHLARMFILSRDGTPSAHPLYQVTWAVYPNLAMDLLVPRLAALMSVEAATRTFYLFSQILIVTGAMAIELVVKGRFHIAGIAAVMFLYSLPFAWGFTNFEFGLGMALWGIAGSLLVQERPWVLRLAVHTAFVVLLFAAHFFALGIYGATIGLHELWRARARKAPFTETFTRLLVLAFPAVALLGLLLFSGGSVGGTGTNWFLRFKPLLLIHIMNGYSLTLSAISIAALLSLLYALARRGLLRIEHAGAWLAIGFAVLYLVMPARLFDTSFVDLRVIVAAALILPAFMSLLPSDTRWSWGIAAVAIAITLANVAVVFSVWMSYRAEYSAMIESFGKINKQSLVLVGHSGDADDPPQDLYEYPIYHAPTLAVHYADAFVPTLFTATGKQPVAARPAHQHLDIPHGGPVPVAILKAIVEGNGPAGTPSFIRSWHRDYDYLYIVGTSRPNPMPGILEELDAASRFVLYRIRKPRKSL
jgi:hypothetical protein